MTDLSLLTRYRENMTNHARKVLDADVEVKLHGIPPDVYGTVPPIEALKYQYTEFLCERFVCEGAINAERNGYDAFTIGCYLDTGLERARALVDIPVLGVTETAMVASCMLGKKFSIITIGPSMQEHIMDEAIKCGLEKRAAAILSVDPPVIETQMEGDEKEGDLVEKYFLQTCDKAIEAGADVIIPGEGVLNEFLYARGVRWYKSLPILDANAIMWQYAVMLAKLKQTSGIGVSRRMAYAKPPADLLEKLQGIHTRYNLSEADFS
jgi:Asp/Glu/hydantoin racemase